MAKIDIRSVEYDEVDTIVFADAENKWLSTAVSIVREGSGIIGVQSDCQDDPSYKILNKEHALHLIKALNKAIELGWLV